MLDIFRLIVNKHIVPGNFGEKAAKVYLIKYPLSVYQSGKCNKAISKALGLQRATVKTIISK